MFILTILLNILFAYLILFPIIFIHEFGHALVAKTLNFKVFSITMGYGKKILETNIFNTQIRFNSIPLQGITQALPETKKFFKTRMWFYVSGGLMTHILLIYLCYLILGGDGFLATIYPNNLFIHFAPITVFIYANAFIFLGNAIPQKLNLPTGNAFTDGYHLLTLPFKKSEGLDGLNLIFEEMKAIEYIRQEKYDEALEMYEKFQQLKPDNFLMNLNIGQIQLAKGNLETARDMFVEVLEKIEKEKIDDKNYDRFRYILYNNIAWTNIVFFREDLLEQADNYSNKALNSSPRFGTFLGTRGAVLIRKGEMKEGIELLKKAYKYQSENASRSAEILFIGIGEAKLGNAKKALKRLEQARNIYSNYHFFSIAEKEILETVNFTGKNN